ncbi:hypothetical protein Ade02nite_42540 [Paractinoplanes deccanensis]|uniref:Uncharacterized protein n=1 Tax=Paractinoplanes deccanensis TaxID=113561 RepID=A0ABQ3Y6L4_9ACTN|nr:hypothetical protein [Actinoplanes deccanensis]GID75613.1 hypothetical protein Ade02nite_42540 [Actinoplanes deccanensis]
MSMVDAALLRRAGDLKGELVAFSRQPRYDRAVSRFLAEYGNGLEDADELQWMLLWDCFVLEHRLANGRTVVDQFVDARPDLPEAERQMVLGWRDVVQGPFEVKRQDGPVLVVESLVDDLTYRVRSNMGPAVFRRTPRRSFLIARLVAVGDEWMLSGPIQILRASERDFACQLALDMSLRTPEAVFRNPEKLAQAWEHQRADRARFVDFFGTDLLVVPGEQVQERLDGYHTYCRDTVLGPEPKTVPPAVSMSLPSDLTDAETVGLIYDETDGLGFYADFGLVEQAFANPELLRRRRWREQTMSYVEDDSVEPMVLRRLAGRDPEKATVVFRRLLKRPRFDWDRDGEQLMREVKPGYFDRPPRPRVSPLSERLAEFAKRR